MTDILWVYMTAPTLEEAKRLGAELVEQRLAACVNVTPGMTSLYWWEGAVQEESEVALVAKTQRARLADLERHVTASHPYDCPCMVALPVANGHAPFLDWIREQTVPDGV